MASNMKLTASASLSVNGSTPSSGPSENVSIAVNFSSGALDVDDSLDENYIINAGTTATAVNMVKIVTGKILWLQTSSPIEVTITTDLGAGPVDVVLPVETMLLWPGTFTGLKMANSQATAAKVAMVIAGNRAPYSPTAPGIQ